MMQYEVATVWWPEGWEPCGPLDVPNCLARVPQAGPPKPRTDLKQALATVRSLNRQNMDRPGNAWYVVEEVGGEAPETAPADQPLRSGAKPGRRRQRRLLLLPGPQLPLCRREAVTGREATTDDGRKVVGWDKPGEVPPEPRRGRTTGGITPVRLPSSVENGGASLRSTHPTYPTRTWWNWQTRKT